jgi:hypothetical protein
MLSGECINACDYGVNPRFLLAMARLAIAKAENGLPERRRQGLTLPVDVVLRSCATVARFGAQCLKHGGKLEMTAGDSL